jgi:AraC-like DNA-binding protein
MTDTEQFASRQSAIRFQLDRQELSERISSAVPGDGRHEVQPGLYLYRATATGEVVHIVAKPSLCIIAQGGKEVVAGESRYRYDRAHYLITTVELPLSGQVVEASQEEPYLSLRLTLDPSVVTTVLVESGSKGPGGEPNVRGIEVSTLSAELLNAVLRLVRMLDDPLEFQVLSSSVIREIVFRLLVAGQRDRLRHLVSPGGQSHRMVRAIQLIRDRFDRPIRVEHLAEEFNMSVSGFHAHFKAATSMSPLQFQKQLRLQEARRLMLDENHDAAEAGFRVGYEDAAHFSRDYKRQFGMPPRRDADRLR